MKIVITDMQNCHLLRQVTDTNLTQAQHKVITIATVKQQLVQNFKKNNLSTVLANKVSSNLATMSSN